MKPRTYNSWSDSLAVVLTLCLAFLLASTSGALALDGTWVGGGGNNNYNTTANWSSGNVANGTGATATINVGQLIVIDSSVTAGTLKGAWNSGSSLVLSGSAGQTLTFAVASGMPAINFATWFSRNDYFSNLNISGTQGLSFNAGSNDLVLQSGVTWSGFSGTFTIKNSNNDGGIIYAQGDNVLPPVDFTLTPGNETNGYGNAKLILNGFTNQTVGALISANTPSNTAYISSYDGGSSVGSAGTPSGTNAAGLATLTIGVTNNDGAFSGIIGEAYNNSGNAVDSSAAAANLAINKIGAGTQLFSGLLTYSGTTTVSGGALLISGTHAAVAVSGSDTGAYLVSAGATLGGAGTIRPASASSGGAMISISGTLAPGNPSVSNGVGTLTFDGTNSTKSLVSLGSGAVLGFDLAAGGVSDQIVFVNSQAGDLTFNNNTINFNDSTFGSLTSGAYILIQCDASNVFAGLTVDGSGNIASGLSIGSGLANYPGSTLQLVGNNLVLNLAPSTVAGTPSGVNVAVSGTLVTVSWNASTNATSYIIYRSTTPNGTYTSVGTSSSTSFVDTGALNGTTYYYEVAASNGTVTSPASGAVSATPLDVNAISVIGVHLRAYSTYGMAVSDTAGVVHVPYWNNLLGPAIQGETTTLSSLVNQLGVAVPGVSISWTAGNTGGSYSNCGTIQTGSDAVTVPPATNDPNLFASVFDQYNSTPSTLSVSGLPYSSYDVIFYLYDGGSARGGAITIGTSTYYIRGGAGSPLASGSGYVQSDDTTFGAGTDVVEGNCVRFSGLSGSGFTANFVAENMGDSTQRLKIAGFQIVSHDAVLPPTQAPSAPAGFTASGGNSEVHLNWSASATATAYKIYRGISSGSYSLLAGGTVSAPLSSYADLTAVNGTTYYYAVSAVNSAGEGSKSTEASAAPATPSFTMPQRTVYQYSVPMAPFYTGTSGTAWPYDSQRRAYLWIPPGCTKIQGVMVGLHNMLEKPMFDDSTIRQACADANIAIVFIAPGDAKTWTPNGLGNYKSGPASTAIDLDPNEYYSEDIISGTTHYATDINPATGTRFASQAEQAGAELAQVLTNLAVESGYSELQYAPILLTDHSAGSNFLWTRGVPTSAALTGRVFAILPNKGFYPGSITNLAGIPIFHVSSEYQEISDWGETWEIGDAPQLRALRAGGTNCLIGECIQPGTGHYEYVPQQAAPLAAFIKAAAAARVPANWTGASYPVLNSIAPSSGWVIDVRTMGSGTCQTVSYATWIGAGNDPLRAYWYPDQATAQSVCDTANAGFRLKPQMINAFQNSSSLYSLATQSAGTVNFTPTLQADGVTFQVRAAPINQAPTARLYNGSPLGMASGPIVFAANGSGSIKQMGADTFRIWLDRESVVKGGQPWEPFVLACQLGDGQYRSAYRPIWINTAVPVNNINGTAQVISFPTIPNQIATNLTQLTLTGSIGATASSGLPIQYWVASGPYRNDENDGSILVPDTIPASTSFPMRTVIGAWQWGSPAAPQYQSATPVFQTFWIFKDGFQLWQFNNFGSYDGTGRPVIPSGNSDDTATPAGDGIPNLLKYATGLSPLTPATSPATEGKTVDGTRFTLTFNEIADPTLTYTVEASNDMTNWSAIWSSTGASNVSGSVTVQDTALIADQPRRFLRLRVTH